MTKTLKNITIATSLLFLFNPNVPLLAQAPNIYETPALDISMFGHWPKISEPAISNNGKFATYNINEMPTNSSTLVLLATDKSWEKRYVGVLNVKFLDNNKQAILKKGPDSLILVTLGNSKERITKGVSSFILSGRGSSQMVVYKTYNDKLVFSSAEGFEKQVFERVKGFKESKDGSIFLIRQTSMQDKNIEILSWFNVKSGKSLLIYEGSQVADVAIDNENKQVAFTTVSTSEKGIVKSCWYFTIGMLKAEHLLDSALQTFSNLTLDGLSGFNKKGDRLYFQLKEIGLTSPPNTDAVKLDVWSYTDTIMQTTQQKQVSIPARYLAFAYLKSDSAIYKIEDYENRIIDSYYPTSGDDVFLMRRHGNALAAVIEDYWNQGVKASYFLLSGKKMEKLKDVGVANVLSTFSPTGKYIISNDESGSDVYVFDVTSGKQYNLTQALPIAVGDGMEDRPSNVKGRGFRTLGWIEGDSAVLVADKYDIWELHPKKLKHPLNLTKSFGRKNQISFKFPDFYLNKIFLSGESLIINGINQTNYKSGFYSITAGVSSIPSLLSIGDYYFASKQFAVTSQIRARDADVFILRREKSQNSPNFYVTKDFKTFSSLSNLAPESEYNWLKSELISFKTLSGSTNKAIIYKPQNFDAKKKYPVIVHYYERMSQLLNSYPQPYTSYGHLDIAWFVSHGYVVAIPDIYYRIGEPGRSASDCIIGLSQALILNSWVDKEHIGLQGHSFGAYQTNYVITQTDMFAAAMSSSGQSNFTSAYFTLDLAQGNSQQGYYERFQGRMGATLWEQPEKYIENSPIFYLDKISTPLLSISNKGDARITFAQGLELFSGLRRLGKRAWMLQYDEATHGLITKKDERDLLIRTTQFFDHYLKDSPAPRWMLYGIPAKFRGIDDGLELVLKKDKDGKWLTPGSGLLIDKK